MSTVLAVKKDNKIVIASDTLAVCDSLKISNNLRKNSEKIIKLENSYMGIVGDAVEIQVINSIYRRQTLKIPEFNNVDNIFDNFLILFQEMKDKYHLIPAIEEDCCPGAYEAMGGDILIANKYGIFGINSDRLVTEYKNYAAIGSGCCYALGALHASYDANLSAEEIVLKGLNASEEFDVNTKGPFNLYYINIK